VICILTGCVLSKLILSSLASLRKWQSPAEAARYLSEVFGKEIIEADILRFALDGHLKLSVNLINGVRARKLVGIKDVKGEDYPVDINTMFPEYPLDSKGKLYPYIRKSGNNGSLFLRVDRTESIIDGVWDLTMIGGERLGVERECQIMTGGPTVALQEMNNVLVERSDSNIWLLQEHYGDIESRKGSKTQLTKLREYIKVNNIGPEEALELHNRYSEDRQKFHAREWGEDKTYIPPWLPEDSVLVVRKEALMEFEQLISNSELNNNAETEINIDLPTIERENDYNKCALEAITQFYKINGYMPTAEEVINRLRHKQPFGIDVVVTKEGVNINHDVKDKSIDDFKRGINYLLNPKKSKRK
jgi:hypothetical protein